jgi:hypothetical protein
LGQARFARNGRLHYPVGRFKYPYGILGTPGTLPDFMSWLYHSGSDWQTFLLNFSKKIKIKPCYFSIPQR